MTDGADQVHSLVPTELPTVSWNDNKVYVEEVMKLWAQHVYTAKITDMNVGASDIRQQRFQDMFIEAAQTSVMNLKDSILGPTSAYAVSQLLATDDFIIQLDMSCNEIKDRGASAIASMLMTNQSLVILDLKSCAIGINGGISLSEALKSNKTLTHIDLGIMGNMGRNHLGIRGTQALSDMLTKNQVLTYLSLNGNGISTEGTEAIARSMYQNVSLLHLDIGSNGIDSQGFESLCRAIMRSSLESLVISRNEIGDSGAPFFPSIIQSPSNLKSLEAKHIGLSKVGGIIIGKALQRPNMIETLILDNNNMTTQGCRQIIDSMREGHIRVQHLSLANNKIDKAIAYDLEESLKGNSSLTKLNLSSNWIGNEGCLAISRAIPVNSSLKILDISYNKIGDEAGVAFIRSLRENTSLIHVNMRYNKMRDPSGLELIETLRVNPGLLNVDINFNELNYRYLSKIDSRLAENNRKHKKKIVSKYVEEIERLKYEEAQMNRLIDELKERAQVTLKTQMEAAVYVEKCREFEAVVKKRAAQRDKEHTKIIELKQRADLELRDKASSIARTKSEKESKYRSSIVRLQKETEMIQRIEKRIRQVTKDDEEAFAAHQSRMKELTLEIRMALDMKDAAKTYLNYHTNSLASYQEKNKPPELSNGETENRADADQKSEAEGSGDSPQRTRKKSTAKPKKSLSPRKPKPKAPERTLVSAKVHTLDLLSQN